MADKPLKIKRLLIIGLLTGAVSGAGAALFFKGVELGSKFVLETLFGYHFPVEGESFFRGSTLDFAGYYMAGLTHTFGRRFFICSYCLEICAGNKRSWNRCGA